MKKIIVDNYLMMSKDLIGQQINLQKPNAILLFLEICRLKRVEFIALQKNHCNEENDELIIPKDKLRCVLDKQIINSKREIKKVIDDFINGAYFTTRDGEIIQIIESITFDKNNGEITVIFTMNNFIKYFINIDNNFTKLPLEYFKNIKSKNVTMLLMYIMKYSDTKRVSILRSDLLFMLNIDEYITISHLNQTLKRVVEQMKNIKLEELTNFSIDKNNNGNFNIKFKNFTIDTSMDYKRQQEEIKSEVEDVCSISAEELAVYGLSNII